MSTKAKTPKERGEVFELTISDPAAANDFSYTLPAGYDYLLESLEFTFVSSGTVATRILSLLITDGSDNNLTKLRDQGSIVASQTVTFNFALGYPAVFGTSDRIYPLPGMDLLAGWKIKTSTSAIAAGDQISGIRATLRRWVNG